MADNKVAVLVLDGEQLVGIFSERDYARKVILMGKASSETAVAEIMTDKVMRDPANTVQECMALMTKGTSATCRYLDDEQKVIGVVSIGDLVKGNDLRTAVHHRPAALHHQLTSRWNMDERACLQRAFCAVRPRNPLSML